MPLIEANTVAKNKTDKKKIMMPIPNIIEPSSRTEIGESGKIAGWVDEEVTVHVCSTMRGGSSVL